MAVTNQSSNTAPLFHLGRCVVTRDAYELLDEQSIDPMDLVSLHQSGSWGCLGDEDWERNDEAVKCGERIISLYPIGETVFSVITEADRSATTVLLFDEY